MPTNERLERGEGVLRLGNNQSPVTWSTNKQLLNTNKTNYTLTLTTHKSKNKLGEKLQTGKIGSTSQHELLNLISKSN